MYQTGLDPGAVVPGHRPDTTSLDPEWKLRSSIAVPWSFWRLERTREMAYLEGQFREVTESGEHTGYILEVEVDVSRVQDVEELANEQVALTGDIEFVDYPERGKILVFRVTSGATIDEAE